MKANVILQAIADAECHIMTNGVIKTRTDTVLESITKQKRGISSVIICTPPEAAKDRRWARRSRQEPQDLRVLWTAKHYLPVCKYHNEV